jgi:alkylation response protein AidB-like acyl-CoA dehydrogenase
MVVGDVMTELSAGLDLGYDDDAVAMAGAVHALCDRRGDEVEDSSPPSDLWTALADMGVLGLSAPGEGSVEAMSAVMVELGRAALRGPFIATAVAVRLLDVDEAKSLIAGDEVVSVGTPPLMPWAPLAGQFIELSAGRAWRAAPDGPVKAVETLAQEPWGRCSLARGKELAGVDDALAVGDVALASYLCGAGERLLSTATTYAAQRTQFGRPIGEFQAVCFPLADVRVSLTAASVLARIAANGVHRGAASAGTDAAVARASATGAALTAAFCAHQTLGAMGFTTEGPVARVSTLIRQLSMFGRQPAVMRETILAPHHL